MEKSFACGIASKKWELSKKIVKKDYNFFFFFFEDRLKQERGGEVCDCKFARKKAQVFRDPCSPLNFNEVLEKILEQGLDVRKCIFLFFLINNFFFFSFYNLTPTIAYICFSLFRLTR